MPPCSMYWWQVKVHSLGKAGIEPYWPDDRCCTASFVHGVEIVIDNIISVQLAGIVGRDVDVAGASGDFANDGCGAGTSVDFIQRRSDNIGAAAIPASRRIVVGESGPGFTAVWQRRSDHRDRTIAGVHSD